MRRRIASRATGLGVAVLATAATMGVCAGAASAETEVVYDNLAAPAPGNVVSEAFEATQTSQFGGQVELAGTDRKGGTVTVGMSSWACQQGSWTGTPECVTAMGARFAWPITLSIYSVGTGGEVGTLLKTVTRTFNIPYRPSENKRQCKNGKGEPTGAWYDGHTRECFHGKYITISFPVAGFRWPSTAIISVAYNTSHYGTEPQAEKPCNTESGGCPYDSLNVGLTEPPNELAPTPVAPSVGSDPLPAAAYQNTKYAPYYCDGGVGGVGVFRLDSGCWTGYQPLIKVRAGL